MSIVVNEIHLFIYPNTTNQKTPIPFTYNLLYGNGLIPNTNYKNPYITADVIYPSSLFGLGMSYTDKIAFFFDKPTMIRKLTGQVRTDTPVNVIYELNIMFMLEHIFPTNVPFSGNVSNSRYMFRQKPNNNIPKFLMKHGTKYSYVTLDGKPSTVVRTVLLDDVINNPVYGELMYEASKYIFWTQESKDIAINITTSLKKVMDLIFGLVVEDGKGGEKEYEIINSLKTIEDSLKEGTNKGIEITTLLVTIKNIREAFDIITIIKSNPNHNETIKDKNIGMLYNKLLPLKDVTTNVIKSVITKLNPILTAILQYEQYKETVDFFKQSRVNVTQTSMSENLKESLSKIRQYTNFVAVLTKFMKTGISSTNDKLQTMIDEYAKDMNTPKSTDESKQTFPRFVEFVISLYKYYLKDSRFVKYKISGDVKNFDDFLNLSVIKNIKNEHTELEAYIMLDAINAVIDMNNVGKFKCVLKSEMLGTAFENAIGMSGTILDVFVGRIPYNISVTNAPTNQTKKGGRKKHRRKLTLRKKPKTIRKRLT